MNTTTRGSMRKPGKPAVLFIVSQPFFEWRGSPIRVGFDVQALAELGYAVDLLTVPHGADRSIPGVRLVRVARIPGIKRLAIGPSLPKALFDVLLLFKGLSMIRRRRYTAVHGVEDTGIIAIALARLARARAIFEKHSDPGSYKNGGLRNLVMWLYARVEHWVIRHCDAVIGTGPGLVEQARRACPGKRASIISDIPSSLRPVTEEGARRVRDTLARGPNDVLILYVGSFAAYQGIDLLFDAIPRVHASCPEALFIVIGGNAEQIAARQAAMDVTGVGEAVRFLGTIAPDRLPDTLAAADILLSPRISGHNTPLKLLDYLKAGRAIVATDLPANRQILDEECAVFARPEPAEFATALIRLARDREARERLSAKGRVLIETRYNFEQFKRGLSEVYAQE